MAYFGHKDCYLCVGIHHLNIGHMDRKCRNYHKEKRFVHLF